MLLGFKKQFKSPIKKEIKGFTLRDERKNTPKIGETLYMYTGLRTKACELITSNYTLKYIYPVKIEIFRKPILLKIDIQINGNTLSKRDLKDFVLMDGFKSVYDFLEYWTEGKEDIQINKSMMMYGWIELPKEWGVC
jgi:hypothetical protein